MAPHQDVNLPSSVITHIAGVMPLLVAWLREEGIAFWCRAKKDSGAHAAPFWVYMQMSCGAPSRSECQA